MAVRKYTYVNIILFACLIILMTITTGCNLSTPGRVELKTTGTQQETTQPTVTSPTPAIADTALVPEDSTRTQIITYTIQNGDTIFGIAEQFNLKPETILWGNPDTFGDLPNISMMPGIVLNILPVDGAYHRWEAGEDLNEVAKTYGVSIEVIINWPGNHLDPQTLGNYSDPNIEPGTMLVIPGGNLQFTTWYPH